MISPRQFSLLGTIIKAYIDSARPIASNQLVTRDGIGLSPATIRHDMAALTEAGYLVQPHTSAGRIPTEKAWHWYIQQEGAGDLTKRERAILESVVGGHRPSQSDRQAEMLRQLAKTMAEMVDESVLVTSNKYATYYTGLSNVFAQPEFEQSDVMLNLTRVVDRLDDLVAKLYDQVGDTPEVLVGRDNPISRDCGVIIVRYRFGQQSGGLIGILGPIRQDYADHLAMLQYAQKLLANV